VAKVTAPLLSFSASGQVAKTQVYGKWKGRSYVRRHVVPSNPQTSEQSLTRDVFSFLQSVYKTAPTLFQAPWQAYAVGKVLTDRNAFTKFNLANLREESDLLLLVGSPGAEGGLPPTAQVVTPGDDQLSVAITAPSVVPTGWTVVGATTAIIRQQDPHSGILYTVTALQDTSAAYVNLFTGLASAETYIVMSWLEWLRPDGKTAYSPSIVTTGLTT